MIDFTRFKDIREDHDISQEEIARILNVNRSTYSMWESGINIMPLEEVYKFAQYFNFSIDYVLGLTNNRNSLKTEGPIDFKKIGNNFKKVRLKNNLYQKDVAEILKVNRPCITKYENGSIHISTSNLYKFCKKFNVTFEDIVTKNM